MIMLAFNIRTVAIGAVVCAGVGAVGIKYVEWRIEKLKYRNFMVIQRDEDLKRIHCNVKQMKSPQWPNMLKSRSYLKGD